MSTDERMTTQHGPGTIIRRECGMIYVRLDTPRPSDASPAQMCAVVAVRGAE